MVGDKSGKSSSPRMAVVVAAAAAAVAPSFGQVVERCIRLIAAVPA